MKQILEQYKNYLIGFNKSLEYYHTLRPLFVFLEQLSYTLEQLDEDILAEYFAKNNYQESRKNQYIKACKHFFNWYWKDKENPFKNTKQIKEQEKDHTYITYEEFRKSLSYVLTHYSNLGGTKKIKVVLSILFYTGLRISELVNRKREDFNLEENYVRVYNTKNKRKRIAPFPETVKLYLQEYFVTEKEETNAFNITKNQVNTIVKKVDEYLKDKHISVHSFRHSTAHYLLSQGVPLTVVSKILGHNNIQTTMRYSKATEEEVKNVYKKQRRDK